MSKPKTRKMVSGSLAAQALARYAACATDSCKADKRASIACSWTRPSPNRESARGSCGRSAADRSRVMVTKTGVLGCGFHSSSVALVDGLHVEFSHEAE
ncbi:hypothetical protein NDR89_18310 [Cupriavidus gilardii]|uniref:Uncharacterized protein n=1 Tax=Cupriavidus gilardii TaxID=82541 RepID=A0ABY4VRI6_9BURK|nr:hypothetical protein [Cupriavidus gilardii]USE78614.1 hypothetical protein NDR89_18310 [Cupriavidus gilardii]